MAVAKNALPGHDAGYKRLFSHPSLVEGLLRGFLQEDWIERLDFPTLEKVSNSFVSEDLRERHSDVVWRLRLRGGGEGWIYLYLLLEFQSTSDHFMALRLLTYVSLLLEEIVRKEKLGAEDRLPAVLPLVLYNGSSPWHAPRGLRSLFAPVPKELQRYLPRLTYFVLDERRLDLDRPELVQNRTAALFRIETTEAPEALPALSEALDDLLPPEDVELRRTVHAWFTWVVRRRFPDAILPEGIHLKEAPMLEETLVKWRDNIIREERQKVLLEQMTARFGRLPREIRSQVEQISSAEELRKLARRVLKAKSLQEMGFH
jgi:putative YhgA-like transposase